MRCHAFHLPGFPPLAIRMRKSMTPLIADRSIRFFLRAAALGWCLLPAIDLCGLRAAEGQQDNPSGQASDGIKPGHSFHGEAFNEGPRQAAKLMPGLYPVQFPVSSSPLAQKFIEQGISQFHGFWFWEAERSFRQAAAIDPQCAMAYVGMAWANNRNEERAKKFLLEANKYREKASDREKRYLDAYRRYYGLDRAEGDKDGRSRADKARDLIGDMEKIAIDFPEDLEAKALLCYRLWESIHEELPITSHLAIDALLEQIFAKAPMHPAHHYRIHLWDHSRAKLAVQSAVRCGPASPAIAHMWHMPGHTFSELRRYHDAVYQQEASARVDHAYMMRQRVLPDQIHNFAHNNEWLIRNLLFIGRVDDAIDLARNMISLPRHPKYNNADGGGSSGLGRDRLLESLLQYRLWDRLLQLKDAPELEETQDDDWKAERTAALAIAGIAGGDPETGARYASQIESRCQELKEAVERLTEEPPAPPDRAATSDWQRQQQEQFKKSQEGRKKQLETKKQEAKRWQRGKHEVAAHRAASGQKWNEALEAYEQSDRKSQLQKAEWLAMAGKHQEAIDLVQKSVQERPGEVLPLAVAVHVYMLAGKEAEAKERFESLRKLAAEADLATPLLARLNPLAIAWGHGASWATPYEVPEELKGRTPLETLGPFRWSPYQAPSWTLQRSDGQVIDSQVLTGKPTVLVFYLGFGCLHCVEQLKKLEPKREEFQSSGLQMIAVSTESQELLQKGMSTYDQPLSIPLLADPTHRVFRDFGCYDDFEQTPLHGTFVIDAQGRVVWQDISHEPFMDIDFLHKEAVRQLKLTRP